MLWRLMLRGTPIPGDAPSDAPGISALGAHLLALRKYFLLGAGDFWHAFLLQVCWQNLDRSAEYSIRVCRRVASVRQPLPGS